MRFTTHRSIVFIAVIVLIACFQQTTSAPAAITKVGQWGSGLYNDVFVDGSFAYCAAGTTGIDIINISDPGNLTLVSSFDTPGYTRGVYVSAGYAYVADGYGLQIIDISNPSAPCLAGLFNTGVVYGVYVTGGYAYLVGDYGLQIIDISDPSAPSLSGSFDTPGSGRSVYVSGSYAYVADLSSGLQVINISTPSAPFLIGSCKYTDRMSASARGVYVSGSYAYVADEAEGLQIIDISDPSAPSPAGSFDTSGNARSVYVSGSYAYVTEYYNYKGLTIIDISDPSAPSQAGSLRTSGFANSVYVAAGYAYVADYSAGLKTVDISTPWEPSLVGTYDTFGDARDVYVSADYAYVADGYEGLRIIDISDPSAPSLAGSINTPGAPYGVYVSAGYAYVASYAAGIQIVDISDPSAPSMAGSIDTPGYAFDVYVSGGYAYVADGGGLKIIDISDPLAPSLVGTYDTFDASDVYVFADYAYIADGGGLKIIDISDPSAPALTASIGTGWAWNVYVSANYAYVAGYTAGLTIIDISDPSAPALASSIDTPGDAYGVYVSGGYAYVADHNEGLTIIDISNPSVPSLIGSFDTSGYASNVYVSGNYAYVADGTGRFVVLQTDLPMPEMNLKQGTTHIPNSANYDFGRVTINTDTDIVFTIENTGDGNLMLPSLPLAVGGDDPDQFSVQSQPTSPIGPGDSVTFTVRFSPTSEGDKSATISILNSDEDETPYYITVTGTAQPGRATMISPEPYTPLAGAQATFTWNQSGADQYWLQVGTTLGGSDIYNQDQGASTQAVVSGLPYKGQTVFVRLWSKLDGVWKHNDYRYTAYDYSSEWAIITDPIPGSDMISRDVTFQWGNSDNATQYWLQIGTSLGGYDLYNQDQGTTLTADVTNLPYNGQTVFVRLWRKAFGEWFADDYTYIACNFASEITNYGAGVFTETAANLSWDHVHGATQYYLYVGTTPGGKELYQGDQELNTSATITGLPQNGETVYLRLWSQVDGKWIYRDYIYTAVNKAAEISSPADGSVLGGITETFQWNDASADQYWLLLGTSPGASDLFSSGALTNTTLSQTVDNLPFQGEMLYARLYSQIGGEWIYNDSIYYAWDYSSTHTYMTSPSVASTFASREQTFEWTDSGADQYWLQIGTASGGDDLYSADQGKTLTDTVSGLPHNGETVWARLWQKKYNIWTSRDYVYTAVNEAAAIYDPADDAAFDDTEVTFHWNAAAGTAPTEYWLWLGTSAGANDLYNQGQGGDASATVAGLPDNGLKVYARLWSKVSGDWIYSDHVYHAVNPAAGIYDPNPGSTLASDTVEFCWSDATAEQYWLYVGTTAGGSDLYSGDQGAGLCRTVSGLPTNGQTVFARIYSKLNGQWLYNDHTYFADNDAASTTSPTSDSTFGATFVTFTWNDTDADQYWLSVGLTVGGGDIYSADQGRNLSAAVSGLPHNGETVYVRLWSKVNGVWISRDHVYTATNDAAVISSPEPPTRFSERTVTFEWNDVGADQYWLEIGSTLGGSDLYSADQGLNTSVTVYGLPINGEPVYARLWSKIDGDWIYSDAVYNVPPPPPQT